MKVLKRNQWLDANKICLANGHAVAKNLMFENKKDHKLFLKLWDRYLGKMTEVLNYHLSPTGWTILFKTKDEADIQQAYTEQRKKSKKAKPKSKLTEASRILSEHFRIMLSQYVRKKNARSKRKGTLVMERFKKYILKDHWDYQKIFAFISQQKRINPQPIKKYQAEEKEYDIEQEMTPNSLWKVGIGESERRFAGRVKVLQCLTFNDCDLSVLG